MFRKCMLVAFASLILFSLASAAMRNAAHAEDSDQPAQPPMFFGPGPGWG